MAVYVDVAKLGADSWVVDGQKPDCLAVIALYWDCKRLFESNFM
jgi:hypothetical protein